MSPPPPPARSPAAVFAEGLERGELRYQVDPGSERPIFYPRVAAPGTGAAPEWRVSEGRGTVYATTTLRLRGEDPRNVALIDLDEGFRLMSRVEGIPPEAVRIGLRVELRFRERPGAPPLPVFVPALSAASESAGP